MLGSFAYEQLNGAILEKKTPSNQLLFFDECADFPKAL